MVSEGKNATCTFYLSFAFRLRNYVCPWPNPLKDSCFQSVFEDKHLGVIVQADWAQTKGSLCFILKEGVRRPSFPLMLWMLCFTIAVACWIVGFEFFFFQCIACLHPSNERLTANNCAALRRTYRPRTPWGQGQAGSVRSRGNGQSHRQGWSLDHRPWYTHRRYRRPLSCLQLWWLHPSGKHDIWWVSRFAG